MRDGFAMKSFADTMDKAIADFEKKHGAEETTDVLATWLTAILGVMPDREQDRLIEQSRTLRPMNPYLAIGRSPLGAT